MKLILKKIAYIFQRIWWWIYPNMDRPKMGLDEYFYKMEILKKRKIVKDNQARIDEQAMMIEALKMKIKLAQLEEERNIKAREDRRKAILGGQ